MKSQVAEISADVVHKNKTKLLVNFVLCDVDVVVIIAVLFKSGHLATRPDVACHCVRDD